MKPYFPSLGLIILLLGFHRISEMIYTPALPSLAKLLIGEQGAILSLSTYFIGFALGILLWGLLSDHWGRRWAMLGGITVYILGSWGCYEAQGLFSLLISRFIQAFGASAGSVVTQAIIRDVYTGNRRNQIFSLVGGYLSTLLALSLLLGGWMSEETDWHGNLALLIVLGVFLFVYAFWKLPETYQPPLVKNEKEKVAFRGMFKETALRLLKDKQVLGYAILVGACNGIIFSYYAEAPFLFENLLHYTSLQYGLLAAFAGVAILLASILSHYLNTRLLKGNQILKIGCYTAMIGALGLSFSTLSGVFEQASFSHLMEILGFVILLFMGIGLIIPNALGQAIQAYQDSIGTAGALFGLFYYLMIAGFTSIMAVLHNGTAAPMPLYFLTLSILMIATFYICFQPKAEKESKSIN